MACVRYSNDFLIEQKNKSFSLKKKLFLSIPAKKCFQVNLFLAQQWRLTKENQLENRLRTWAHGKKKSTKIPNYGEQGYINITKKYDQETILTFPRNPDVTTMKYKTKYSEKYKPFQMWKIGHPIDGVWFNISSAEADGKYLTVTKIGNQKELTMEKGGTVCSA